ncbi:MAG TPA: sialate O-acetylesterase [Polyangiaceae bacterium]
MQLPSLFSNHLVLMRDRENPIWGRDEPDRELTLTAEGPKSARASARADATGRFVLRCPPLRAGGPYRVTIEGSATRVIEDVWVGEVWLASGQSNMEWPVRASQAADREIANAHFPSIRAFKVARSTGAEPALDVQGEWAVCAPDTVAAFSAVGYAFARELHARLGVPIGIIDATWGGTSIDAWLAVDALTRVDASTKARLAQLASEQGELPRLRAEYAASVRAWELEMLPRDPPNEGERRGWPRPEFDDASWSAMLMPSFWQHHGLAFNGVVWFRRELELPAHAAGQDLLLSLGAIDDYDHTYFNGELVGSHPDGTPDAYQTPRRYVVPGRLVRGGKNTIAVRVFDHVGEGGFVGPASVLFAQLASGEKLRLDGTWRYAVEHEIPLVSGEVFASFPQQPLALSAQGAPGALFNGMLAPLIPYGIRGALWYQGESDVEAHATYRARQVEFVRDLRARWGQGAFPFFLVQLAGFRAGPAWPFLREAQELAAGEPGVALATAIDVGEPHSIHPVDKQTVGRRLALLARARVYGESSLVDSGPTLVRVAFDGARARVHYKHASGLRARTPDGPHGFELAGADGIFHVANARIEGETVVLQTARVQAPHAARYAWADYPDGDLENAASLPALPFRTDSHPCPDER